ncbi:MAG: hypothetical protein CFE44_04525 [Burkholderiales bacterium PBB4]|nr:MAG: hypothetical protein CFE44_04525 [Burkholderiales bacterium PBB4]
MAPEFIAAPALSTASKAEMTVPPPVWINLEYLSAERYVERAHALPSPVFHGAGTGRTKHFFYPGFSPRTGGLLREPGLMDARALFEDPEVKRTWLASQGIAWRGERLVSLFCYEPVYLAPLLALWAAQTAPIRLLVTPGRTQAAVEAACALRAGTALPGALQVHYLEVLSQADFDRLLWCCDVNFVRGEDSLVRAIWAGKPLIWHIYPQDDGAHHTKLEACLQTLDAPTDLAEFHRIWNANVADTADNSAFTLGELWPRDLRPWQQTARQFRQRLLEMDDLATQLIRFVQKKR